MVYPPSYSVEMRAQPLDLLERSEGVLFRRDCEVATRDFLLSAMLVYLALLFVAGSHAAQVSSIA